MTPLASRAGMNGVDCDVTARVVGAAWQSNAAPLPPPPLKPSVYVPGAPPTRNVTEMFAASGKATVVKGPAVR